MNAKRLVVLVVVLALLLVSACARQESTPCDTCASDASIDNSNTITINVDAGATTGQNTQATAEATIYIAPATPYTWTESTCIELGETMSISLSPLKEGDFYACVYSGPIIPINIPAGVIADVDRGEIKVALGPVYTESSHVTFRAWDGTLAAGCAQVQNLTDYGQTQNPKFTASPLNFTCP